MTGPGPELVHELMRTAAGEVREAAGKLRTERQAVDDLFRSCVDVSWTGSAASSFLPVFDDWNAGLTDVEEGLAAMGELIEATRRDLGETDEASAAHLDLIASRIVDRLG